MNAPHLTPQEIAARGQALYDTTIRPQVETGNKGRFVILDIDSGEYEIDDEDLFASDRLLARKPDAILYGVRVGYAAAYRLGGRMREVTR